MNIFEIIGWLGAFFFVVAYFLLSIGRLKSDGILYQSMNVLGGLGLVINSVHLNDSPNFVTNLIWMLIGLYAIVRIIAKKRKKN
jgi:lipid-A-disaccharide synthase-like uncharacterized protein